MTHNSPELFNFFTFLSLAYGIFIIILTRMSTNCENRNKIIVRTSIIGIIANLFLVAFKAFVGILSNSIAVILDAINNLTDALSSIITIVGAKLGAKSPDRKHPLGYGRLEYISAMIVAAIVIYAGVTSATESVKKIIHPEPADYSMVSLIIIGAAVFVKILLGLYVKKQGKKADSNALVASGLDALFDSIVSASVFICAVIYILTGISLEAWVGCVISVFIIKSGIEVMLETLDDILGRRADPEMVKNLKKVISQEPGVRGTYDVVISNYGPDKNLASVHIELPDTMTVCEVDQLTRKIEQRVFRETGILISGVGVYSYNTKDDEASRMRNTIQETVKNNDWAIQMHGFYVDLEKKFMRFDVVCKFSIKGQEAVQILKEQVAEIYPDYTVEISPDVDLTDI